MPALKRGDKVIFTKVCNVKGGENSGFQSAQFPVGHKSVVTAVGYEGFVKLKDTGDVFISSSYLTTDDAPTDISLLPLGNRRNQMLSAAVGIPGLLSTLPKMSGLTNLMPHSDLVHTEYVDGSGGHEFLDALRSGKTLHLLPAPGQTQAKKKSEANMRFECKYEFEQIVWHVGGTKNHGKWNYYPQQVRLGKQVVIKLKENDNGSYIDIVYDCKRMSGGASFFSSEDSLFPTKAECREACKKKTEDAVRVGTSLE
jgi:hypothetical protein